MGVQEAADNCLEEGCSLDTVSVLIAELEEERVTLQAKLNSIVLLQGKLQALSGVEDSASKDELAKIVDAAIRSFTKVYDDYPALGDPTAFTGTKNPEPGLKPAFPN